MTSVTDQGHASDWPWPVPEQEADPVFGFIVGDALDDETAAFRGLAAIEPKLEGLVGEANRLRFLRGYARDVAYRSLVQKIRRLVGWFAENPRLRGPRAYDLAHNVLCRRIGGV